MDIRNRTPTKWRNKRNRKTRISYKNCIMGKRNQKIRMGNHNHKKDILIIKTIYGKFRL